MRHPVESVHIYHRRLLSFYRAMSAVKGEWMNEEKRERERERQGEGTHTLDDRERGDTHAALPGPRRTLVLCPLQ